jgi:hypothetical protein
MKGTGEETNLHEFMAYTTQRFILNQSKVMQERSMSKIRSQRVSVLIDHPFTINSIRERDNKEGRETISIIRERQYRIDRIE